MEFSKHNWATISETICPEMLIIWHIFFQNILTNPMISEIGLWRHTLVVYLNDHQCSNSWLSDGPDKKERTKTQWTRWNAKSANFTIVSTNVLIGLNIKFYEIFTKQHVH